MRVPRAIWLHAAPVRSAGGIATVGKRPFVSRQLYFAGRTLQIFIRWDTRRKNNRSISVVLVSFPSNYVARHGRPFGNLHCITIRRTNLVLARHEVLTAIEGLLTSEAWRTGWQGSAVVQPRDLQILAMTSQLRSRHRCISVAPMKTLTGLEQTFSIELQTK